MNFVNPFSCLPLFGKPAFPPFSRPPGRENFAVLQAGVNLAEARPLDAVNIPAIVNFRGRMTY